MVEKAQNIDITLKKWANLDDTMFHLQRIVTTYSHQVKDLAQTLKAKTVKDSALNIWTWIKANISYKKDKNGIEELRRPARTIFDKSGDCDCMTILACCLLIEMQIDCFAKVVAYPKKNIYGSYRKDSKGGWISNDFGHIYALAIDKELGKTYVIDCVPEIPYFNYEHEPITKYKIINFMELRELAGNIPDFIQNELEQDIDFNNRIQLNQINDDIELSAFEESYLDEMMFPTYTIAGESESDYQIINSLFGIKEDAITNILLQQLKTLEEERKNPKTLKFFTDVNFEIAIIENVINNISYDSLLDAMNKSFFKEFYKGILSEMQSSVNGLDEDIVYLRDINESDFDEIQIGKLKIFTKKPGVLKKAGDVLKKVKNIVLKVSPTTMVMRHSALSLIAVNFARMSDKLAYGYLSEDQAKSKGFNLDEWKKFVAAREKIEAKWKNWGGDPKALKLAVVKGKAGKKLGLNDLGIAPAVGLPAAIAAATPFIVAVKDLFKNLSMKKVNSKDNDSENAEERKAVEKAAENLPSNDEKDDFIEIRDKEEKIIKKTPIKTTEKVVTFAKKNRTWLIISGIGLLIILIVGMIVLFRKKKTGSKRKTLSGLRRKKNSSKKVLKRTSRKTLSGVSKSKSKTKQNSKLKILHAKAKALRRNHPKMKYSTALKKASKLSK